MLAALVGACAAICFDLLVAENVVDRAVELESGAHVGHLEAELFSRGEQRLGLVLGELLFGVAIGLFLGGAAALLRRRFASSRSLWLSLTTTGVLATVLLPAVKYPPLPPGVDSSLDITDRQLAYLAVVAAGLTAASAAAWVWSRVAASHRIVRIALALAAGAVPASAAMLALPGDGATAIPDATVLRDFRMVSVAGAALFWAAASLAGMALLSRLNER